MKRKDGYVLEKMMKEEDNSIILCFEVINYNLLHTFIRHAFIRQWELKLYVLN